MESGSYLMGVSALVIKHSQKLFSYCREQNARLVPLMLQELHKLQVSSAEERQQAALAARPFAHLGHNNREIVDMEAKNGITVASRTRKRVSSHHKENGIGRLFCILLVYMVK